MKHWFSIIVSLVFIAGSARAEDVRIVWSAPGCHFPVLGWRMPVRLDDSDWRVDRAITGLAAATYNCHYYTRLHLADHTAPEQVGRWLSRPRFDGINAQILREAGMRPRAEGEPAGPGDILVAGCPLGPFEMVYTHSAIVRSVDDRGRVHTIRQKFDDEHPVVDVDWSEFRTLYAGRHPYRTEVWTWSESSLPQVVCR